MTYRSYCLEYRSNAAEIGTAISNEDDSQVIVITMYRPTALSISTKSQLDNLYNFLFLREDNEKTRILLKHIEGKPFDKFVDSTTLDHGTRVQIALELLKKLLRYDNFPNSIKQQLIDEDQIIFRPDGVWFREIVNYTDKTTISDKEIVSMLGKLLRVLLPDSNEVEIALISQMENRNNDFYTIEEAYTAFRDVFIYSVPATVEKRFYIYNEDGPAISADDVNAFIIEREKQKTAELQRIKTEKILDEFEELNQKINHEAEVTIASTNHELSIKEVPLSNSDPTDLDQISFTDFELSGISIKKAIDNNKKKVQETTATITSSLKNLFDGIKTNTDELKILPNSGDEIETPEETTFDQKLDSWLDPQEDESPKNIEESTQKKEQHNNHESDQEIDEFIQGSTGRYEELQDEMGDLDDFYARIEQDELRKNRNKRIITISVIAALLIAVLFFSALVWKKSFEQVEPRFSYFKETKSVVKFENNSKGVSKTQSYIWEIYFNDKLLEEVERKEISFAFKQEGLYKITLVAIGKDGQRYGPYELDYNFQFEKEE